MLKDVSAESEASVHERTTQSMGMGDLHVKYQVRARMEVIS